jgi:hypothetical protein
MREDSQKCYNNMPAEIKKLTYLVTHSGRADILRQNQPDARIVDLGNTDGIADVRQKVLEHFGGKSKPEIRASQKIMIIDDSCTFKMKTEENKLVNMNAADWFDMFQMVSDNLENYPMVGISDQGGNNRVLEDVKEIGRTYSCYGLDMKFLKENDLRFDGMYRKNNEIKLYEDFYLILSILTSGHKNALIYKYAFNHPHGKKGGNSTVRTNELQKKCLLALKEEFPGLVELVKKEDPSWKAGLEDTDDFRWEARIAWQEAYKQGLAGPSASLDSFFA